MVTVANNLEKTGLDCFGNIAMRFPAVEEQELSLLVRKGIYTYEYMESLQKMNEAHLQPKEAFFSSLTNSNITEPDYAIAKQLSNTFNVRTMRAYHELYILTMFSFFSASLSLSRSLLD